MTKPPNILHEWRISRKSFAYRCLAILVFSLCFPFFIDLQAPLWISLASAILSALFLMWSIGDFDLWLENRTRRWYLTTNDIRLQDTRAPGTELALPLANIRRINRFPLWTLVLRLHNGQAEVIPLPPSPRRLKAKILAARDAIPPKGAS